MSDTDFAKSQLSDHLSSLIVPAISQGIWSIHESAEALCKRTSQVDDTIRTFQNMLTKIPEWSDHILTTEVERIAKSCRCAYLDDLVMGVFIAYMKSFASLHYRGKANQVSVDFDRPSLNEFVHRMYIHSARKLWQVAYLFKTTDSVSTEQQARNRQEIQNNIRQCVETVIHSFLPWEAITKSIAQHTEEESESDSESENEKKVQFDGDSSDDESEAEPPKLNLTTDAATIDVQELDIAEDDEDPMKEIEKKVKDSLVLKL